MNEIPDDEVRRLSERFATAASKLTPVPHSLAEIRGLVQRRLRRRRVTRVATVAGAAAAVVVVALTVNAVTGSTPSHPVLPAQSVTPSPSSTPTSTPTSSPTTSSPPSSPTASALVPPPSETHPFTGPPPVASSSSGALQASVVKQITLPGSGADAIAVDSGVAYVVDGGTAGTVSLLDLATDVVGKTIAVGAAPVAVAVDPVLHTAYVVNSGAGTVSVIDKASASVVATVTVGSKPVAIAVDSTRHLAYVVNNAANSVSILDETTNTVTDTLQVGPGPVAVAVDNTTNTIYVANTNSGQGSISRINGATHGVIPTEALGTLPVGLTIDPAHSTLYVESFVAAPETSIGSWLVIMDEKTLYSSGSSRLTFDAASTVAAALDSPANALYIVTTSNVARAAGQLLVAPIPDNFLGLLPSVPVGVAPKAVALDPATHDLYVVNGDNTITLVAGVGSRAPA
jgi:YVTN family beta-propeller protein